MVSDDGERISDNLFSVGSGSIYAYSILDASYKYESKSVVVTLDTLLLLDTRWARPMLLILLVARSYTLHIVMRHRATLFEVMLISARLTNLCAVFSLSYEGNWLGKDRRKRYQWLHVSISCRPDNELLNSSLNFDQKHRKSSSVVSFSFISITTCE